MIKKFNFKNYQKINLRITYKCLRTKVSLLSTAYPPLTAPYSLRSTQGFTLIETLIYGLLVSGMILVSVLFSLSISEGNQSARAYQEVQQNARMAMERMIQEIRAANNLDAAGSVFGTSPGTLSLTHDDASKSPTVFDVSGEILRIRQGTGAIIPLTSDLVRVTTLTFTNLSVSNRTKNIRISLTIEHLNPENIAVYQASTTIQASATIRSQSDLP